MALGIQTRNNPVMTTDRSVTASTMKYGSMAELLDAARKRRTMMMVMTLPNTPRSIWSGKTIFLAKITFCVNSKKYMCMLTGDRGSMVMFGTALVMTDEILLLFSMTTGTMSPRLSVFEVAEQTGFRTD